MSKQEFLQRLEGLLAGIAPEERVAAMQYYTEYLDDAGPEREAEVLAELGSPEEVAAIVRAESGADGWTPPQRPAAQAAPQPGPERVVPPQAPPPPPYYAGNAGGAGGVPPTAAAAAMAPKKDNSRTILIILGIILLSPVIIGLLGGLGGVLVAAIAVLAVPFIVGIALAASGVAVAAVGVSAIASLGVASGLLTIGVGLALLGLGLLCGYGGVMVFAKLIPALFRGISSLFRRIFKKGRPEPWVKKL